MRNKLMEMATVRISWGEQWSRETTAKRDRGSISWLSQEISSEKDTVESELRGCFFPRILCVKIGEKCWSHIESPKNRNRLEKWWWKGRRLV
jgi:hypothetical protein